MVLKEHYVKYSLVAIIIILGIVIFKESSPFLGGIMGACTLYVLLRKQMLYLTKVKKMKSSMMATLLLFETILCFLIPLGLLIWFIIYQVQYINLNVDTILTPIQRFREFIQAKTNYNILQDENIGTIAAIIPRIGQWVMNSLSSIGINILMMLFILYFMLTGGIRMEKYVYDILPFHQKDKIYMMHEIYMIVKSNAIAIPLLAVIQGGFATLGYYLFSAPNPFAMGLLTGIATIIPIIGTGLVWAPLILYMAITGDYGNAILLLLYSALVITNIDNVARFMLQKKIADIHPLITIFGVIIGISLFGFMGVIFGPLMLSIFILCVNLFKREYLDRDKTHNSPRQSYEKEVNE